MRAPNRRSGRVHVWLVCLFLLSAGQLATAAAAVAPTVTFLEILLNGQNTGQVATAYFDGSRLWLSRRDLRQFQIHVDAVPTRLFRDEPYTNLDQVPGLHYQLDTVELRVDLQCLGGCLETHSIDLSEAAEPAADAPELGAFLNYTAAWQRNGGAQHWAGAYEAGLFDGFGVITSSGLVREPAAAEGGNVRLDSTWTFDVPDQRLRTRMGDAVSRPGAWGVPLRFGGVQFGTDFSLQPYFVPFPTPDFAGEATVPSVVDVYVNNVRQLSEHVQPGPFEIRQIPVITGNGDVVMIIRDELGRQQTVTAPYYVSPQLLRADLSDYSVEAGALRQNYARNSFDYSTGFVSATLRHGVSSAFTLETRAEVAQALHGAGVAGVWVVPALGQFSAATAWSAHDNGSGYYGAVGLDRITPHWNAGIKVEGSTPAYARLGNDPLAEAPRQGVIGRLGLSGGSWGYWGLGYTRRQFRDATHDFEALFTTYGLPIGARSSLTVFGTRTRKPADETFLGLTLTCSFGDRGTGSASAMYQDQGSSARALYQEVAPVGGGWGYRAQLATGQVQSAEAGVNWDTQQFLASADVTNTNSATAARADLRGGIAWFAHDFYFSRPIEDSFGVVDASGVADMPVLQDNQQVGRTDSHGRLFIRRLRAYQRNKLAIDPSELPLSVQVNELDSVAVPRYRSGTSIRFDLRETPTALLRLVQPDGQPVAAGASVIAGGRPVDVPVSLDGRLYLDHVKPGEDLEVSGPEGSCRAHIPDDLPQELTGRTVPVLCQPSGG